MAALLGSLASAKTLILGEGGPSIDNWTFRLYYRYSTTFLMGASLLVTANQFFGEPILCDMPNDAVNSDTLKSYCWMYSTFNMPREFSGKCARKERGTGKQEEMYNSWYQWVSICLVLQSLLFYLPRLIWMKLEGGLMKHLAKDKQGKIIQDAKEKCDNLVLTYKDHLRNKYNRYFAYFVCCEGLNVVMAVGQIFITDKFLNKQFLGYGLNLYRFYQLPAEEIRLLDLTNPMCEAFPRVASCQFYIYGSGGQESSFNALCVLALNVIIDKVYLIFWFWFIILVTCGCARLLQRVFQVLPYIGPSVRYFLVNWEMHRYFKDNEHTESIKNYFKTCSIGDWFVLYQMSQNLNKKLFFNFIILLAKCKHINDKHIENGESNTELIENGQETQSKTSMKKSEITALPTLSVTSFEKSNAEEKKSERAEKRRRPREQEIGKEIVGKGRSKR